MKVTKELSISNFDFWGGAKDRAQMLTIDELNEIERQLEMCTLKEWMKHKSTTYFGLISIGWHK